MIEMVTRKSIEWEDEAEYRFLKTAATLSPFPCQNLVSIYVGCNASLDDIVWLESVVKRSPCEPHLAIMKPTVDFSLEVDVCLQNWDELKQKLSAIKI